MKRILFLFFIFHFSCSMFIAQASPSSPSAFSTFAQQVRMRDVFAAMPDSLLPLVTKNNRLDCIDFFENNMEAKAKNKMDQYVTLKALTANYLLFETSEVSRVEMKLLPLNDSSSVVCMVETCDGPAVDSNVSFYMQDWKPLEVALVEGPPSCTGDALLLHFLSFQRPDVEDFFPSVPDSLQQTMKTALLELKDLPCMSAKLSPDNNTMTWTLSLEGLAKEEKSTAQQCLKEVVVKLKD